MLYLIDTYIVEGIIGIACGCFGMSYFVGATKLAAFIQLVVEKGML